jgi:hypothetical protein
MAADFPAPSVTPYPLVQCVRAVLLDDDASKWGGDVHPHFVRRLTPERLPTEQQGGITVNFRMDLNLVNAPAYRPVTSSLSGPSGPNVVTSITVRNELDSAAAIEDDSGQDVDC